MSLRRRERRLRREAHVLSRKRMQLVFQPPESASFAKEGVDNDVDGFRDTAFARHGRAALTLAARARQGKSLSLTGTYAAHPEDAPGASRWAAPKALLCITFSANGCAGLDPRQ